MTKTMQELCEKYLAYITLKKLGERVDNELIATLEEIRGEADRILL